MKRKICSVTIALLLIILAVFAFSSCSTDPISILNTEINDDGELVIYYSDGSEKNLGVVVGKDGKNGKDGKDGVDGIDGKDGKDGVDGKDGIDGENGKDGINGSDGADGSTIITGGEPSLSSAIAKGLRSSVSIVCKFTQSGGWFGSSSTSASAGSGVIYKINKSEGDAFIITNYHVVYYSGSNTANGISDDITVYLYGSETAGGAINATYVGGSLIYDIAILRVENSDILKASDACAVNVADSNDVVLGETAIAIGNAKGYGISSTSGIISVDSEYIDMTAADEKTAISLRVMRVDTAVNPGNSGGGLFNNKGELIGIVNAKIVDDGVESIGYAIPTSIARAIADNIIYYCYDTDVECVYRAMLGITVLSSDHKAVLDTETGLVRLTETVSIGSITETSIAKGILEIDDILISATLNGEEFRITRNFHVVDMMLNARVGDVVQFVVLRGGAEATVSITVTKACLAAY